MLSQKTIQGKSWFYEDITPSIPDGYSLFSWSCISSDDSINAYLIQKNGKYSLCAYNAYGSTSTKDISVKFIYIKDLY